MKHLPAPLASRRGLTLLELVIVMAVLAILSAIAVPSMASRLRADRLQSAADMLVADIADARHEAARRGQALHIQARSGTDWCWAVATQSACPCGETNAACRLKAVPAGEHPGVSLVMALPVRLEPDGQASAGLAAVFAAGDRRLQVDVSRFGRARVCDPGGASTRVPRC